MRADWFGALGAHVPDPLLLVGLDGTVLGANAAVGEWFEGAARELEGRPLAALVATAPEELERQLAAWSRSATPLPGAIALRQPEGSRRVRCHGARLVSPDGGVAVLIRMARPSESDRFALLTQQIDLLNREIADRKRAEAQREALVAELSRAVRLAEMLMAVLGHDLRNPLGAIQMAAQLAQRRTDDPDVREHADRILRSAGRMSRLIEQLLDVTRLRLGRGISVVPCRLDLVELVEQVVAEVKAAHDDREIVVELAPGVTQGEWDRDRLAQVVSNLLSNACQHGVPGSAVRVLVDGSGDAAVSLSVANEGTAIPDERLPGLFEPFQRGEDSRGLGLGLYIAREIVRAHGGEIAVASGPGLTSFTVSLPRSRGAQARAQRDEGASWLEDAERSSAAG